jgi:zinc protease
VKALLALLMMIVFPSAATAQSGASGDISSFSLTNGMRVVVIPDHRAPVVTHMIWFGVGSADDPPGASGLAHFFEHLMFKATKEIPAGEYSKIVARNGGMDNASTSFDYTNYWFRVASDRLAPMMRLEASRISSLLLSDGEVLSEREVVKEERRQTVDSDPDAVLSEKVFAALFAQHPYGVPVIGRMDEVATLTRSDAEHFYRTWYDPANAIVVVAGDIAPDDFRPLAQAAYGGLGTRGAEADRHRPVAQPLGASVEIMHEDPKVRQPSWTRYWIGPAVGHADEDAVQLALDILGGGRTSRLTQAVVEDRELAVSSFAYALPFAASGVIAIGASPAPGRTLQEVEEAAGAEIERLASEGPDEDELSRAKARMRASAIFARDSQTAMANWVGSLVAVGQPVEWIISWRDRIDAVTVDDVARVVRDYLDEAAHVDAKLVPGR